MSNNTHKLINEMQAVLRGQPARDAGLAICTTLSLLSQGWHAFWADYRAPGRTRVMEDSEQAFNDIVEQLHVELHRVNDENVRLKAERMRSTEKYNKLLIAWSDLRNSNELMKSEIKALIEEQRRLQEKLTELRANIHDADAWP